MDNDSDQAPVIVPLEALSGEALTGIIDAFVLREGTDYGTESSLAAKRADVLAQLQSGAALVVFDPATESVDIRLERDLSRS